MGNFVVVKFATKSGSTCTALALDLGYTKKFISYNLNDIAEILGISVKEFVNFSNTIDVGKSKDVGKFSFTKVGI